MMFPVGFFRTAWLLIAGLMLSGCLPSAPGDEEKEQYYLAGKSRVNTMDFKGAIESFERAVEVNPKSAPAHFELGWLYDQKESDPAAAIFHYERYLKLLPNSGKEDMVKTRVLACKQQLAQTVSLGPVTEKQQREFEQLAEENKRLREELDKWRAYGLRMQNSTNLPGPAALAPRVMKSSGSNQPAVRESASPVRPSASPAATARTHIVKAGETPRAIARKYGLSVDALMSANPKVDPRRMRVGQSLNIPAP
jgi:tetratricopeptide (TPR) repeat protein